MYPRNQYQPGSLLFGEVELMETFLAAKQQEADLRSLLFGEVELMETFGITVRVSIHSRGRFSSEKWN